ncbi:LacI family transcriptional regulator [Lachnospiraceae bacterium ZAX-1]
MLTIKDIARESGYSVSTVSRVLNNRRDVSPIAKKRIEGIVAANHFVPNVNAKHLKQMVSKSIVVLVKGTSNMLFANIVEEIQKRVERTKYTAIVSYLDEDDNEVEQALTVCRERKPLGLLFLGGNPDFFKQKFGEVSIPCVLVTNQAKDMQFPNLSSVATDDIAAAKCAVDYLIERGHTNIGILGGDLTSSYTSIQRFYGCEQSFLNHGLFFDAKTHYSKARFSYDSAYRAMMWLLESVHDITAVFTMSDVMAIGAVRALCDSHLNVPNDISVIGFDGITLAEYYNPKLTTIQQQYKILASRSLEILLNDITLNGVPVHEIVPFHLMQGESVKNCNR